jgi:NAD(P)-dependent dehydrogenase (short-subunit alcohol dehydrogenase family)
MLASANMNLRSTFRKQISGSFQFPSSDLTSVSTSYNRTGGCASKSSTIQQLIELRISSALSRIQAWCTVLALGLVGQPAQAAYSASKGALIAITRSLALELARYNMRVNCVAPGLVDSEMADRLRKNMLPEQLQAPHGMHPLGIGTPEQVGNAIAFLLSDAAAWITGTTLVIDGGYTAQ